MNGIVTEKVENIYPVYDNKFTKQMAKKKTNSMATTCDTNPNKIKMIHHLTTQLTLTLYCQSEHYTMLISSTK